MPETPEERCKACGATWKQDQFDAVGAENECPSSWHDAPPQPAPTQMEAARMEIRSMMQPAVESPAKARPGDSPLKEGHGTGRVSGAKAQGFEEALAISHGTGHPGYFDSCERCIALRTAHAEEVEAAKKAETEDQDAYYDSIVSMTVARLGGMVEGAPTNRHNFLQRIDQLRLSEQGDAIASHMWRQILERAEAAARAAGVAEGRRQMAREALEQVRGEAFVPTGGIMTVNGVKRVVRWLEYQSREEENNGTSL